MVNVILSWKDKKVSLPLIELKMRGQYPEYCGCSAGNELTLHFNIESLDQFIIDEVNNYWDTLAEDAEEFNYKSKEDISSEKVSKKLSAKQKLLTLGLTEEEVSALLGE
jgi:hypothetical protein